jgi:hypothetical protein
MAVIGIPSIDKLLRIQECFLFAVISATRSRDKYAARQGNKGALQQQRTFSRRDYSTVHFPSLQNSMIALTVETLLLSDHSSLGI